MRKEMNELIDLNAYPIDKQLKMLLKDKTTGKNIIFATSVYSRNGISIKETDEITVEALRQGISYQIQPRVLKKESSNKSEQERRQKCLHHHGSVTK